MASACALAASADRRANIPCQVAIPAAPRDTTAEEMAIQVAASTCPHNRRAVSCPGANILRRHHSTELLDDLKSSWMAARSVDLRAVARLTAARLPGAVVLTTATGRVDWPAVGQ